MQAAQAVALAMQTQINAARQAVQAQEAAAAAAEAANGAPLDPLVLAKKQNDVTKLVAVSLCTGKVSQEAFFVKRIGNEPQCCCRFTLRLAGRMSIYRYMCSRRCAHLLAINAWRHSETADRRT